MIRSRLMVLGWFGSLAFGLSSCSEPTVSELPVSPEMDANAVLIGNKPMRCDLKEPISRTAVIGPEGGTVAIDGNSVTLPPGAVDEPTRITMTFPASEYLELELNANGLESFEFAKPVTVSLNYGRCPIGDFSAAGTTTRNVWYVDAETKAFLEKMPSVDDRKHKTVTFLTPHFSFFIVAD